MILTPKWKRRFSWLIEALVLITVIASAIVLWQWYWDGGGFEAVYVVIGIAMAALLTVRRWLKQDGKTALEREPLNSEALQNPRNRENLLNHIQTAWIDGYLKQSLHSEVLKLTLQQRSEAVGLHPWQLTLKQPDQRDQTVPPDQSLLELFTAVGRNLLILGKPGSGKTITMLQLAEPLIVAARQNPSEPLPIILNLSSWAREQKPLAEWIVEEMFVQYGVSRAVTRAGIAQNQFLYLLDGLDEVVADARDNCTAAVNAFKEAHPAEMVVCSRIDEYEALQNQLHLGSAIQIEPLSDAQINAYLGHDELELQAVRVTLTHDPDLKELAKTPLMLSLMTLAYRGLSREALRPLADKEARRRHLFDHYVQQMFERRPLLANSPYTQEQATGWLANLARGMVQHEQSIFYIERLQPTWLGNGRWRHHYQLLCHLIEGLIFGLTFMLLMILISHVFGDSIVSELRSIIFLLVGGLLVGLSIGIVSKQIYNESIKVIEKLNWQLPSKQVLWLLVKHRLYENLRDSLIPVPILMLFIALFGGIIEVPISIPISELIYQTIYVLIFGLVIGLILGVIVGLIVGMIDIFKNAIRNQEVSQRSRPNIGVRQSGWNGIRIGLIIGPIIGLILGILLGLIFGLKFGLSIMLLSGVITGLFLGWFEYGGRVVSQHYALRWMLNCMGVLPYPFRDHRLVAFLDAMHDRILLHRVGGGWVFVHRSLLEYFTSLANERIQ